MIATERHGLWGIKVMTDEYAEDSKGSARNLLGIVVLSKSNLYCG